MKNPNKPQVLRSITIAFVLILTISCQSDGDEMTPDPDPDPDPVEEENTLTDDFEGNGDLIDYVTNNASSLPDVQRVDGRYRANLVDNADNITLHYHEDQGRLDAKEVSFPFEFIARNIGIGTQNDSQIAPEAEGDPYLFCGVQVHVIDLDSRNSSHVVVGHRGPTSFTIEGKKHR